MVAGADDMADDNVLLLKYNEVNFRTSSSTSTRVLSLRDTIMYTSRSSNRFPTIQ